MLKLTLREVSVEQRMRNLSCASSLRENNSELAEPGTAAEAISASEIRTQADQLSVERLGTR